MNQNSPNSNLNKSQNAKNEQVQLFKDLDEKSQCNESNSNIQHYLSKRTHNANNTSTDQQNSLYISKSEQQYNKQYKFLQAFQIKPQVKQHINQQPDMLPKLKKPSSQKVFESFNNIAISNNNNIVIENSNQQFNKHPPKQVISQNRSTSQNNYRKMSKYVFHSFQSSVNTKINNKFIDALDNDLYNRQPISNLYSTENNKCQD